MEGAIYFVVIVLMVGFLAFLQVNNSAQHQSLDKIERESNPSPCLSPHKDFSKTNLLSTEGVGREIHHTELAIPLSQRDPNTNLLIEDETNFAKKKLFAFLKRVNRKPIHIRDPCNQDSYTQTTTPDLLRRTLDEMSKRVVELLNRESDYQFEKTTYGDVQVWCDAKGNKEYKYELFVWSFKNYFQLKLYVNVIQFIQKSDAKEYCVESSPYLFPTYHLGYPCKDQMIPLPHEVIPSANEVLPGASAKPDEPARAMYMYLNHLEVENSTLVINHHQGKTNEFIMDVGENGGVIDNKLEYTHITYQVNPIQPIAREANRWEDLPNEDKTKICQYPCKTPPVFQWDADGIYFYTKAEGEKREKEIRDYEISEGTRWSTEPLPRQPNFWPTLATQPGSCGPNQWLFDNAKSLPGVFVGGGKR